MFELWKGGSFVRIHREGCIHSEEKREIGPQTEHAMYLDGKYETLAKAEAAAAQKASRVKKCRLCC